MGTARVSGKDSLPNFPQGMEWDAVESVLTIYGNLSRSSQGCSFAITAINSSATC